MLTNVGGYPGWDLRNRKDTWYKVNLNTLLTVVNNNVSLLIYNL